jgi:hypothetical protein
MESFLVSFTIQFAIQLLHCKLNTTVCDSGKKNEKKLYHIGPTKIVDDP